MKKSDRSSEVTGVRAFLEQRLDHFLRRLLDIDPHLPARVALPLIDELDAALTQFIAGEETDADGGHGCSLT